MRAKQAGPKLTRKSNQSKVDPISLNLESGYHGQKTACGEEIHCDAERAII